MNKFLQILMKIYRYTGFVLAVCLIMLAVTVSIVRYGFRHIEDYQPKIVEYLQTQTRVDFTIEKISGSWEKRTPALELKGFEIKTDKGKNVRLGDFYLSIDIVKSIQAQKLVLKGFSIKDAQLNLVQQENGKWQTAGMRDVLNKNISVSSSAKTEEKSQQSNRKIADILKAVFADLNRIDIQKTDIVFHFYGGGEFTIKDLDIQLEGDSRHRRVVMSSIIDKKNVMKGYADIKGKPGEKGFEITAYGKMNQTELSGFLPLNNSEYQLENFSASGEFWLDYKENFFEIVGELAIPELRLKDREALLLENFKTNFVIDNSNSNEFLVWLSNIKWNWGGQKQAFTRVFINHDFRLKALNLHIPKLNLASITQSLLASGILNENLTSMLEDMQLSGSVNNLLVHLPVGKQSTEKLLIKANADKVSLSPWKGVPGFKNVTGAVTSNLNMGEVEIDIQNGGSIELPHVYQKPLEFETLTGTLNWKIREQDVLVQAEALKLVTQEEHGLLLLGLELPINAMSEVEPWMTLMVAMEDAKAESRNKYIPYTLDEALLKWLDESLVAGDVSRADFLYEGSISKNPEIHPSVQLIIDVSEGELKFMPDWPAVTAMKGRYLLDDGDSYAKATSAEISNLPLEDISIYVGHQEGFEGMVVNVNGHFTGNGADAFSFLMNSPIHEKLGSAMDSWQVIGRASGDIDLQIPLDSIDEDKQKIWVNANIEESSLRIPEIELVLNHINGALHFDNKSGLSSYGLKAQLWGEALEGRIETEADVTQIKFKTKVSPTSLGKWLKDPLFDFAEGKAEVTGKVYLAEKSFIEFDTDLKGVLLRLPAPFNKSKKQKINTHINIPLEEQFTMDFDFSEYGKMKLDFAPDLTRGEFVINDEFQLKHEKGFLLRGEIDVLSMEDWLPIVEDYTDKLDKFALENPSTGNAENNFPFKIEKLKIKKTRAVGTSWGESVVSIYENGNSWQVDFDSKDAVGQVQIFEEDLPMKVRLDLIRFEEAVPASVPQARKPVSSKNKTPVSAAAVKQAAKNQPAADPLADITASDIPDADVVVVRSFIGEEDYGNWNFSVRSKDTDLQLQNIQASVRGVTIAGNAIWSPTTKISTFSGKATTGGFGNVLEAWDFPRTLEAKRSEFDLDLNWPGSPAAFDTNFVKGDVYFSIDDGQFLEASASASGALKAFSLLNFTEILRRVQFDFSDMKKGVNFEEIKGSFYLNNMLVKINNSIEIKGSAGRFLLSGEIDMSEEEFANELVVTLPVSKNLPWIAVLLGGLNPVGLGAAAVAKVLDKQVDKISSGVYSITGSFDDPQVKFLRVFTDKSSKREVERKVEDANANDIAVDAQKNETKKLIDEARSQKELVE